MLDVSTLLSLRRRGKASVRLWCLKVNTLQFLQATWGHSWHFVWRLLECRSFICRFEGTGSWPYTSWLTSEPIAALSKLTPRLRNGFTFYEKENSTHHRSILQPSARTSFQILSVRNRALVPRMILHKVIILKFRHSYSTFARLFTISHFFTKEKKHNTNRMLD